MCHAVRLVVGNEGLRPVAPPDSDSDSIQFFLGAEDTYLNVVAGYIESPSHSWLLLIVPRHFPLVLVLLVPPREFVPDLFAPFLADLLLAGVGKCVPP